MTESHSKVEQTDEEEANIMIADPDDYQKSKKLKAIHDTKKRVRKVLQNRHQIKEEVGRHQRQHFRATLGDAVAMYGLELMPLIEEAIDEDILSEDDLDAGPMEPNVQLFVDIGGAVMDDDSGEARPPKKWESMNYYQQLQRIQRELGLGLDLEEEQSPAEI
jgi:hypothetical protein